MASQLLSSRRMTNTRLAYLHLDVLDRVNGGGNYQWCMQEAKKGDPRLVWWNENECYRTHHTDTVEQLREPPREHDGHWVAQSGGLIPLPLSQQFGAGSVGSGVTGQ